MYTQPELHLDQWWYYYAWDVLTLAIG